MASDNIECILKILEKYGSVSTMQIIQHANSPALKELCSGCKSGTDVITAGRRLEREGRVEKTIGKGGYIWSMTAQF